MSNFQKLIILIFLALVIGWFYWFQYRPSEAKKECVAELAERKGVTIKNADTLFDICLHKKGL